MWSKILKYFGVTLIVVFCALSTFFSFEIRNYESDSPVTRMLSYSSFLEDRFYDIRMNYNLDPNAFSKEIVLAEINDASLEELGQWPITRETWTKVIRNLASFGAKVISFDVFFGEDSKTCDGINPDLEMAKAIEEFQSIPGNKVIIPFNLNEEPGPENINELPEVLLNFIMGLNSDPGVALNRNYIARSSFPINTFLEKEIGTGHIQAQPDIDGIVRHYQIVGNVFSEDVGEVYQPSFGLTTYEAFKGVKTSLALNGPGNNHLITPNGKLDLNILGETKIRYFGGTNAFKKVPISEIVKAAPNNSEMKQIFDGSLVFIGSTAFGANDIRHTPIDPFLPGVFFHMNLVKMLIDGKYFSSQEDSLKVSWIMLIGGTLIIILVQFLGHPIYDILALIGTLTALLFIDLKYLTPIGLETRLFFSMLSAAGTYFWVTILHFYLANKDKAFLKQAFGSYISPELIDEMYSSGEAPKLGGDSGVRTAYFTDIQGFSTFSEKLTAVQLVELLNEYLTAMTDILLDEKGTLDKYEGDAIIAFFGAPMPLEDHAARACRVAHRMQESLLSLRKKWVSEGEKWPSIVHEMRMRIGINSGEIVTGNMGSASRMNYTMMGDAVNLAARLEESAKQYGIFTQASQETVALAGAEFLWRELDTVRVVGKSVPVTSFDLLGLKNTAPEFLQKLSKRFKEGIELYKKQMWDDAIEIFQETLEYEFERFPELKGKKTNPSEIYLKRCEQYKKLPPPPEWDGVYTLTSK